MASMRQRFRRVLFDGDVSEGLPLVEWAVWWNKTIENWKAQGLPQNLQPDDLYDYFGLDRHYLSWRFATTAKTPQPPSHGAPVIHDEAGYDAILPTLYPEQPGTDPRREEAAEKQATGDAVVWLEFVGAFHHPRELLGIEPHLFAFYEQPDLMRRIIANVTDYSIKVIENMFETLVPELIIIGEDMSYNHGPMISRAVFDEFLGPYYREVVPVARSRGSLVFVDTDGDVEPLIPWLEDVGVQGVLPLERRAGVDPCRVSRNHPDLRMMGGFDKTVMSQGEDAVRAEFERIRPAVLSGRYLPSVDHQTPPDVGLEEYKMYVRLLGEFSEEVTRAARLARPME